MNTDKSSILKEIRENLWQKGKIIFDNSGVKTLEFR